MLSLAFLLFGANGRCDADSWIEWHRAKSRVSAKIRKTSNTLTRLVKNGGRYTNALPKQQQMTTSQRRHHVCAAQTTPVPPPLNDVTSPIIKPKMTLLLFASLALLSWRQRWKSLQVSSKSRLCCLSSWRITGSEIHMGVEFEWKWTEEHWHDPVMPAPCDLIDSLELIQSHINIWISLHQRRSNPAHLLLSNCWNDPNGFFTASPPHQSKHFLSSFNHLI